MDIETLQLEIKNLGAKLRQASLTLLHKALSIGIHASDDDGCLEAVNNIRIVLTELADRVGQVLKEQSELEHAVKKLLSPKVGQNH